MRSHQSTLSPMLAVMLAEPESCLQGSVCCAGLSSGTYQEQDWTSAPNNYKKGNMAIVEGSRALPSSPMFGHTTACNGVTCTKWVPGTRAREYHS